MTFSIVARMADGVPGVPGPAWGVAVASKFLAAGSVVPGAWAGSGAIATQAFANLAYLPSGRRLLAAGDGAAAVVDAITSQDDDVDKRQVGVVDAIGGSATFTGLECFAWAGGRTGDGYAIQGNILTGPEVVEAMEQAWLADADAPMARRLVAALLAGDRAGGDRRGRQSAAVLVVADGAGYGGGSDVAVDLRVDDHRDPVVELGRLLDLHELVFGRPETTEPLSGETAERLRRALDALGYRDPDLEIALAAAAGVENLEERLVPGAVDPIVLEHLEALVAETDDSGYMDR
jgi:uncharacterized Ntn-hydrolase superfamily protein